MPVIAYASECVDKPFAHGCKATLTEGPVIDRAIQVKRGVRDGARASKECHEKAFSRFRGVDWMDVD